MKKLIISCLNGFGVTGPITMILVLINTENIQVNWWVLWLKSWLIAGTLATIITGYLQPILKSGLHSHKSKRAKHKITL